MKASTMRSRYFEWAGLNACTLWSIGEKEREDSIVKKVWGRQTRRLSGLEISIQSIEAPNECV